MLNNLMENLRAMGCNPEIIDGNTVKINAPKIRAYRYNELSDDVKTTLINNYLNNNIEFFKEDFENDLRDIFPNSELTAAISWLCCQGDGANIYGKIDFSDFIKVWNAPIKDKKTMLFYISKSLYYYEFTANARYSYSCKFIDKKEIDALTDEFIYYLSDLRGVNRELITRFYTDLINYFENLDVKLYRDLYEFIYNPDADAIGEYYDANGYLFTKTGDVIL